ncbi:hypothetical protein [Bradyrhizobium erythrophlei]|jgi:hypothetical protein|uniref:Yip1 domain-containing protein n=1 Tax=Bradyrhizobium erythrophlei TaxID=1437360 RepID=A0A1M5J3A2_9BRAD|nr:hypothetical protein [Bradyrhizobium erythrophlei]SHG35098.1 hypothetical protein SAMN05444169_1978 [Bradyrhizobium erythrophlei]
MAAITSATANRPGHAPEGSHAGDSFPWGRFPAGWAVESAFSERFSARLIWLLVPLQYYALTHIAGGVGAGDLLSVIVLTMTSFIALFFLSFLLANFVAWRNPDQDKRTLTRMWMIALMMGTTCAYAVFALSLWIGILRGLTADIVGDFLFWQSSDGVRIPGLNWQTVASYLIYSLIAMLLILSIRLMSWTITSRHRSGLVEPPFVVVAVFVAAVMSGINIFATF